jgi:heterodisulfide reductase subunit C
MIELDFNFREKLNATIGGDHHSYCFQCGACVGDCPTARYTDRFNPRLIVLRSIFGQAEELTREDSIIWLCTNCYNCYERCPQDVRPVEVIMALKNIATRRGANPEKVRELVGSINRDSRTVVLTSASDRRRETLGLKPVKKEIPADFTALLKEIGAGDGK